MATKMKQPDYRELNEELEQLLDKLQTGELNIDEALPLYERGMELIKLLEEQLTTAQNRVQELQANLRD